jgi:signal peptidase I
MIIRWLLSSTVRHAVAMRRHVEKLLAAQRDILPAQSITNMEAAIASLRKATGQGADKVTLLAEMQKLEDAANKWLKPYPHPAWRENVEVFLVAIAVAMAIRTFFLQPFKIPTGSMQPTLYGITPEIGSGNQPDLQIPNGFMQRWDYWFHGYSYFHETAPEDGVLDQVGPPKRLLLFNLKQEYVFNGRTHTIWFPADDLFQRAGICPRNSWSVTRQNFKRGEDIIKMKVIAGDHLFVNRVTYNFLHPQRGDIVVFSTKGFDSDAAVRYGIDPRQYYIKRLVALGGETVSIGVDQHLVINGRRLDSSTPHFANVYNFRADAGENQYFGHTFANDIRAFLWSPNQSYSVQPNHYMVMGDNTRNSLDSRYLGDFGRENVIGKSSFVYWPISSRFGFGYD